MQIILHITKKDLISQVFSVGAEGVEPPTLARQVLTSGLEPSTLKVDIADGSILQDLTVHANAPYRGWFSIQARTFHT